MIAERHQIEVAEAFTVLRGHARGHRRKLTEVAVEVVEGKLSIPRP